MKASKLEMVIIQELLTNIKYENDLRLRDHKQVIAYDDTNDVITSLLDCFFAEQRSNGVDIDSVEFLDEMFPTFGAEAVRDAELGDYYILEKIGGV